MRTILSELSGGATISAQDGGCNNSLPLLNGPGNDQIEHPSANPVKFFADTMNMDFVDSSISVREQSERIDRLRDDVAGRENVPELGHGYEYDTWVEVEKAAFAPHASIYQDPGVSMTEVFLHHEMRRSLLQFEDAQNKLETNWHSQICLEGEVARSLSLMRPNTPFNTNQSIPYPKPYLHPTPTMIVPVPSSSGLYQLETNWHSQIHLDGEGERSLSLMRPQTPFNTNQSIPYPIRYLHPTPTMSVPMPSSSGLYQLETNWHSQIHLDDEGERSLSLTTKQTPFNNIQPVSYPEQYLDLTPIMNVTKPSTSGLQLNNVFNSGATVNVKSAQRGSFCLQEMISKPLLKPVAESLLREDTDDNNLKSLLYAHLTKSPNKFGVWNPLKDPSTQADKNKRKAEDFGDEEEFYRSNLKKGRQAKKGKPKSRGRDTGIISCQCKKSKCMKLYCECFAARVYCAETCSCQGCLNVKECDDEILEARELIESRNPLAFAPKVVQHSIEASAIGYGEDGTRLSPSSARHIKGCNCKRSMCVKKYCHCYQLKVGCSDGCHCEGCQNVYGQRGEKGIMNGPLSGEENNQRTDSSFLDSFNTPAPTNTSHYTYLGTDQITTPNSTPPSPQVSCSTQEEEPNIWSSLERYLESPEFRRLIFNNDRVIEIAKETIDKILSTQEPDVGNEETTDGFEFAFPIPVPNYMEWTNSSTARFPSAYIHSSCASLNWHRSRISPQLDFRGKKLSQVDAFEHEFNKILKNDQPETLEDTRTSVNTVKVSTQDKKRVCPPDPVQEFGSTPPVGSLKSVSTSPVQQMKDPQYRGGNK